MDETIKTTAEEVVSESPPKGVVPNAHPTMVGKGGKVRRERERLLQVIHNSLGDAKDPLREIEKRMKVRRKKSPRDGVFVDIMDERVFIPTGKTVQEVMVERHLWQDLGDRDQQMRYTAKKGEVQRVIKEFEAEFGLLPEEVLPKENQRKFKSDDPLANIKSFATRQEDMLLKAMLKIALGVYYEKSVWATRDGEHHKKIQIFKAEPDREAIEFFLNHLYGKAPIRKAVDNSDNEMSASTSTIGD